MKKNPTRISTGYLYSVYDTERFNKLIDSAYKRILKFKRTDPFDAIAFTGTSGAALAYPLSYKLKIPLICIRKSKESSHYKSTLEGAIFSNSYIIVDDCIDSGRTVNRIMSSIKKQNEFAFCKGIFLYSDLDDMTNFKAIPVISIG